MAERTIRIGNKLLGPDRPVFVIAEAGVNHNGNLRTALRLIDAAKRAGADAVKFQTYRTEELVTAAAPKAGYQNRTVRGKNQFSMLRDLQLSAADFRELAAYCRRKKIIFMSTPFDLPSADLLQALDQPGFKISSGEITNYSLLRKVASFRKPVILSTGMSTLGEVARAVKILRTGGTKQLVLLHCTSNYPAEFADLNLLALKTLQRRFGCLVGYSDHSPGVVASVAAVALGAKVIEKHFTLDKKAPGPDHQASLDPAELEMLVASIRRTEQALGDGDKKPRRSELPIMAVARKKLVAARDLAKGVVIRRDMVAVKRAATGLPAEALEELIGTKLRRALRRDEGFPAPRRGGR